jgi:MoxR-like ATPase
MTLKYQRLFDATGQTAFDPARAFRRGDAAAPGGGYVHDDEGRIELAVNLALATGRPLLVRGVPGTGKSSLAKSVASGLGWRYYEHVVSSRTQARDLLWTFDAVKRLGDAQVEDRLKEDAAYITPGVLWWAFARGQAAAYGKPDPAGAVVSDRAVVLIDEIDKADPDVPNDLLVPLGSLQFDVDETPVVATEPPLVIITTNEERDLPRAFLRRCVTLTLEPPDDDRLTRIARAHFKDAVDADTLSTILISYRAVQARQEERGAPQASIAEFLDAVAAARNLGAKPGDASVWELVAELTLDKPAGTRGDDGG